ncbi:MAG: D-alanyl-D-alanine carboxypeptidase [Candidatus Hydrogenedentes bacterium]|nr:D-alanyl-D-alanine carboxypeptidase [Candidatus Hydrogenedentota bacterium]
MLRVAACLALVLALMAPPAHAAHTKSAKPAAKPTAKSAAPAKANWKSAPAKKKTAPDTPPLEISWICVEASTGMVLGERDADAPRPPASMIKMMQFLMVTDGLKKGLWTLDTPITVTAHSENMGGTQVYLKAGETFKLGHLMEAEAVASANDAAMAVAEGLWGSEEKFKVARAEFAKQLGLTHSDFQSVHGLPPGPGQKPDATTARDLSIVARHCAADPQIMKWVGTKEVRFRPDQAPKPNTNKLLWRMEGCDGLKTGFTNAAGFCITATAQRNGIRLITVLMGCEGKYDRFNEAQKILEDSFPQVQRVRVIARGEALKTSTPVLNCVTQETLLTASEDLWVVVKAKDRSSLHVAPEFPAPLRAPLTSGTVVGEITAELGGKKIGSTPLAINQDLPAAGWRWKLVNAVTAH